MYNHYIPQSDGSYRRSSMPDQSQRPPQKPQKPHPEPPQKPAPKPTPKPEPPPPCPPAPCPEPPRQTGLMDFLRNLLPRGIDTADMMIVCLLLLMNQDQEDGLSPMITLALYFLL